ncbi:MAG: aldo/keto reductase [Selenomonadaceae bacterium]|nr:aldo/keto reductase [Selenomonadaceae bacterium]
MKNVTLGTTGITVPQNAFGALPIQRVSAEAAIKLLRRAYEGGMRYFDTARAYSDSEEKIGLAFAGMRDKVYIATKTMAKTPAAFNEDLATSLKNLQTDYIDVYQFHCAESCYRPDDGTGLYEAMEAAKKAGKIRHIGITAHKIGIAMEAAKSGLYETVQFPFSYLSGDKEEKLVRTCYENKVGFVCMKGLAGGLITNSRAAMAFTAEFPGALPIWGIQKEEELTEWLSYMEATPTMTAEIKNFIEGERRELSGNFCRGCGYCMPCPAGITINQCARMSLMLRRAPSKFWLSEYWQKEMKKIEGCLHCNKCMSHCPYELNTPELLAKNYEDYQKVLAGEVAV